MVLEPELVSLDMPVEDDGLLDEPALVEPVPELVEALGLVPLVVVSVLVPEPLVPEPLAPMLLVEPVPLLAVLPLPVVDELGEEPLVLDEELGVVELVPLLGDALVLLVLLLDWAL